MFCGADENIAKLVVMAGEETVKKGVNASEIAKEASVVLGGGGSGSRTLRKVEEHKLKKYKRLRRQKKQ